MLPVTGAVSPPGALGAVVSELTVAAASFETGPTLPAPSSAVTR